MVVDTEQLPVCAPQIAKASQWSKTISIVMMAVQSGRWPNKRDEEFLISCQSSGDSICVSYTVS